MDSSDRELLDAWREGDKVAGNQLLRRHFTTVYRFFRSKLGEDARDLTQRTFLAAVESRDRISEPWSFRGYVLGVARRLLLFHLRSSARHDRVIEFRHVSMHDLAPSPTYLIAEDQEQVRVMNAMRRIPIDFQIALELYYWEEMSVAEIAQVLEVPKGTVRSRLTRAREHLRKQLAELGDASHDSAFEPVMAALKHTLSDVDAEPPD